MYSLDENSLSVYSLNEDTDSLVDLDKAIADNAETERYDRIY